MRTRRLLVPVTFHDASWHRVVVGVRRCPPHQTGGEAGVLAEMHDEQPGWQTLAVCEQQPVRWGRGCSLRVVVETPGSIADDIPRDLWNPNPSGALAIPAGWVYPERVSPLTIGGNDG